ncbi:MAG: hypothetical protein M1840_007013 [Geoglossum simile]|nr:MAG: hypothetical protein M1840_007013 [Geoglossum simile]
MSEKDAKTALEKGGKWPLLGQYIKKSGPQSPSTKNLSQVVPNIKSPVDDEPLGYPRLAAFIDSDPNFMICRCFGTLHTRLLLYRQDELATLETRLARLDSEDSLTEDGLRRLASRDLDEEVRQDLIDEIEKKLKAYDDLVLRCQSLNAMGAPTARNISSLAAWVDNEKPLCKEEMEFVHYRADLVTLAAGKEDGWLNGLLAYCVASIPCGFLRRLFSSEEQRQKTDNRYLHYVSSERLDLLTAVLLVFVVALFLIFPVTISGKTERVTPAIATIGAIPLWLLVFATATRRKILNGA